MSLGERVLEIADAEEGTRESPMGSNTGPRIREYQAATWLPGTGWPWCSAFICWCYEQAGKKLPFPTAGAYDMLARGQKAGWGTTAPQPGDPVIFNTGSGHVGLFIRFQGPDVVSLDGNTSDMVAYRTRPRSLIRGCIHVPGDRVPALPPVKKPVYEVVRGEGDRAHVVFTSKTLDGALSQAKKLLGKGAKAVRIRKRKP